MAKGKLIVHVSWSEIDTARQCLQKHHLRYKSKAREQEVAPALTKGVMWHEMMDDIYQKEGDTYDGLARERLGRWKGDEHHELIEWMLDGYCDQYGEHDEVYLGAEQSEIRLEAELPDVGFGPLTLVGVLDLLYKDRFGHRWLVDHKSGKYRIQSSDLEMADQWTLYTWLARQNGYEVYGSMHNWATTYKLKTKENPLDQRFIRTPVERTDREVESVIRDITIQAWHAKGDNGAPRSPGDHCKWRCSYKDYCVIDRRYGGVTASQVLLSKHKLS